MSWSLGGGPINFRIADTFTDSLAKLTSDERTAAKVTAFDLQTNPSHPSIRFHRVAKGKDKNFWSGRVTDDIRIIIHRLADSLLVCYVDHHDAAYKWAERRKIEVHPVTGAAQIVEVRETVREVLLPSFVAPAPTTAVDPPLFDHLGEDTLLGYGVPPEWISEARSVTADGLTSLIDHLPSEAAEALFALATGEVPVLPDVPLGTADPFEHPAAQRRFRTIADSDELALALEYPWEKWTVFLHPAQRDTVERSFSGPARVSGSAGTGKTIVALHRAMHLAEQNPNALVLLSTFSPALAEQLRVKLGRLLFAKPRLGERIEVESLDALALRIYRAEFGRKPDVVEPARLRELLLAAAEQAGGPPFTESFLVSEWDQIIDAWQLRDWESYRTVQRLGRKVRLPETARVRLWGIFQNVITGLGDAGLMTLASVYSELAEALKRRDRPTYEHVVLDEAQDASAAQLRFLAQLVGDSANGLFFAGDLGQRIFQQPFSWLSVGVDVRGRSRNLKVNYRTSHQIRRRADLLLDNQTEDVDGENQDRRGTVSVFNGPEPVLRLFETAEDEIAAVAEWLRGQAGDGRRAAEVGVFVRSESELVRAITAVEDAGLATSRGDSPPAGAKGKVTVATMHAAKGLEYRTVAVMACDQSVIPSASREAAAADMVELQEVNDTERHLLYVALTRARDDLWVSGVKPGSVFLRDLSTG